MLNIAAPAGAVKLMLLHPLFPAVSMPFVAAAASMHTGNQAWTIGYICVAIGIGTTAICTSIRQLSKAFADSRREQALALDGTHFAELGQLRVDYERLKAHDVECEKRRTELEREIREIKDELGAAKREFKEEIATAAAEVKSIRHEMFGAAVDVLVHKGYLESRRAADAGDGP